MPSVCQMLFLVFPGRIVNKNKEFPAVEKTIC